MSLVRSVETRSRDVSVTCIASTWTRHKLGNTVIARDNSIVLPHAWLQVVSVHSKHNSITVID